MSYELKHATQSDIEYITKAKLYNIFNYAHNLFEEEINKINNYVENHIPNQISDYKLIVCDNKIIGCLLVLPKDDGIIIDELFLEDNYRNKGIGSDIINNILKNNSIVYLWVYKENVKAISLYKKLGFNVIIETETRYYMKFSESSNE